MTEEQEVDQAYSLLKIGILEGEVFERIWRRIYGEKEMSIEMLVEVLKKWNF